MDWVSTIEKLGIKPPDSNRVSIRVGLPPVSQQASGDSKRAFIDAVRSQCGAFSFLVTCDVKVEVTWRVHEQERYETDRSPDVDNILKPLLDGLCGPDGLLIDDNQIQSVCCSWIDWTSRDEEVVVDIDFQADEWMPRGHFHFIQFDKGLCYPVATYLPRELQLAIARVYENGLSSRKDLESQGVTYEVSRLTMPVARIFHRTRIGQFPVLTYEEFKGSPRRAGLDPPL